MTRLNTASTLEFTNAYMFSRVMGDESICRGVLESILGFEIGRIEYRNSEQEFQPTLDGKGIKLDVFAKAGNKVFDVEMQTCIERELPRRARYYQSAIDTSELKRGSPYDKLPDSYIIFICKDDQLGASASRYEIEQVCVNHPEAHYNSGAHVIVLNASAWSKATDDTAANLLKYIATGADNGTQLVSEIIRAVDDANSDREWVNRTMGFMSVEYALKCKQHELDVAVEKRDAAFAELDAAKAELDAAKVELSAAIAERDTVVAESDAAAAERDAAAAERDAAAAERDAANKDSERRDSLAKTLNEKGRGSEYFAALDDEELMGKLFEEFGL